MDDTERKIAEAAGKVAYPLGVFELDEMSVDVYYRCVTGSADGSLPPYDEERLRAVLAELYEVGVLNPEGRGDWLFFVFRGDGVVVFFMPLEERAPSGILLN